MTEHRRGNRRLDPMSRLRFATARALYETFPVAVTKLKVAPTDASPVAFLKKLSSDEKLDDAVTFCAFLLPRREAVWWACGSARSCLGAGVPSPADGLDAAEAWVHEPNEQRRLIALDVGSRGGDDDALTWLARAAGWAGGTLTVDPKKPVPVPQYLTPRAARIAILLSAHGLAPAERAPRMRARIAEGIKLAEGGP
jgi:hypothetical protein